MKRKALLLINVVLVMLMVFSSVSFAFTSVPVKSISLNKTSLTLAIGKTVTLTASISPTNATNKVIIWSSSDNKIAKVNAKGVVTGVKIGKATITAKSSDGKAIAKCIVTVSKVDTGPVTISLSCYHPDTVFIIDSSDVQLYLEKKFNVKLKLIRGNTDTWDIQVGLWTAANDLPDVFQATKLKVLVEQGSIGEIKLKTIQKFAPKSYAFIQDLIKKTNYDIFDNSAIEKKNYIIPRIWMGGMTANYSTSWRMDILKSVGINEPPATIDQYEEAFKQVKAKYPNKYGFTAPGKNNMYFLAPDVYNAYSYIPQKLMMVDGKLVNSSVMPETKQALATLRKWFKAGYIDPEFITDDWNVFDSKFINGKTVSECLTNIMNGWPDAKKEVGYNSLYAQAKEIDPNAEVVVGPFVKGPTGKSSQEGSLPFTDVNVFSKKMASDAAKVQKYLEIWEAGSTDEEVYSTIIKGIKGKHWNTDANGDVVVKEEFTSKEAKSKIGNTNWFDFFFITGGLVDGNFPKYTLKQSLVTYQNAWREKYKDSIALYFQAPFKTWLTDETIKATANLDNLWREYFDKIIIGQRPLNDFDEFVKRWYAEGGQKRINELLKLNPQLLKK